MTDVQRIEKLEKEVKDLKKIVAKLTQLLTSVNDNQSKLSDIIGEVAKR